MSYPTALMREYYLLSQDHGTAGDTAYSVGFTTRGELVVRVTKRHDERHRPAEVHDIGAREFADVTVQGRSLLSLVIAKLEEILPR
jgi:hypothetical protein